MCPLAGLISKANRVPQFHGSHSTSLRGPCQQATAGGHAPAHGRASTTHSTMAGTTTDLARLTVCPASGTLRLRWVYPEMSRCPSAPERLVDLLEHPGVGLEFLQVRLAPVTCKAAKPFSSAASGASPEARRRISSTVRFRHPLRRVFFVTSASAARRESCEQSGVSCIAPRIHGLHGMNGSWSRQPRESLRTRALPAERLAVARSVNVGWSAFSCLRGVAGQAQLAGGAVPRAARRPAVGSGLAACLSLGALPPQADFRGGLTAAGSSGVLSGGGRRPVRHGRRLLGWCPIPSATASATTSTEGPDRSIGLPLTGKASPMHSPALADLLGRLPGPLRTREAAHSPRPRVVVCGRYASRGAREGALLALWPGLCIAIVVYGINMFGDALRDLLDPRLRGGAGRYGRVRLRTARVSGGRDGQFGAHLTDG